MTLPQLAPWIAAVAGAAAVLLVGMVSVRTWRQWRRARVTQEAATALIAVHQERLDASLAQLSEGTGRIADGSEELADEIAELKADVDHLRWMLGRIPEERERLTRELGELVLPSGAGERGRRSDDDA